MPKFFLKVPHTEHAAKQGPTLYFEVAISDSHIISRKATGADVAEHPSVYAEFLETQRTAAPASTPAPEPTEPKEEAGTTSALKELAKKLRKSK